MDAAGAAGRPAATVGKLIDHIFLVERRHLQRLMDVPVATVTGLTGNNSPPLFDYGASVRRELEQYVGDLDEEEADQVRVFEVRDEQWHDIAAQAAVPHPAARDPALGADRAGRQAQRPRAARRARSRLQQSATLTSRLLTIRTVHPAECAHFRLRQPDMGSRDVLFQVWHAGRARNGQHDRRAAEQPRQRDL